MTGTASARPRSLVELLRSRAEATPERTAFHLLADTGTRDLGYAELDARARALAATLLARGDVRHQRALLLHPPGLDYLVAFFGCLYAGMVAVPGYPPADRRSLERLTGIAADCTPVLALTDRATLARVTASLGDPDSLLPGVGWLATDEPGADPESWRPYSPEPERTVFLQYTSGSTSAPKGVVLSHGNLLHNAAMLRRSLRTDERSVGVSWLPPYHDMGLIGGILQPLHDGFPCALMAPMSFARSPIRWLEAISEYRATISPAPDFAYAECVRRIGADQRAGLDLSSWRHALVGAEPIRAQTLERFAAAFAPAGFDPRGFYPCYGLAEATLFVTGGPAGSGARVVDVDRSALGEGEFRVRRPEDRTGDEVVRLVGCGRGHDEDTVLVIDPQSRKPCRPGRVGEVWVSGPVVAQGYWGSAAATTEVFGAELADGSGPFLRTGDLGALHGGELFITGRAKELIVVRGRNHYPQDIELTAERAHPQLQPGRGAAFGVEGGAGERVVLVHELARGFDRKAFDEIGAAVREAVVAAQGIELSDLVLVRPGAVPRTSSGKIRRRFCREEYLAGRYDSLRLNTGTGTGTGTDTAAGAGPGAAVRSGPGAALKRLLADALDLPIERIQDELPLPSQGLDSLRAARLSEQLWQRLTLDVTIEALLGGITPVELARLEPGQPAGGAGAEQPRRGAPAFAPGAAPAVSPASPGQRRIWVLDQAGAGAAYRIAAGLRLPGPVDRSALVRALVELQERHEALRTTFRLDDDGRLLQEVRPGGDLDVPLVRLPPEADGASARDLAAEWCRTEQAARPFDLTRELPLRAALLATPSGEHILVLTVHHIAVDGWSFGVLLTDLLARYRERSAGEPTRSPGTAPRFADLAAWQHEVLSPRHAPAAARSREHWRRALSGAAPLELPTDRPRPTVPSSSGDWIPLTIEAELAEELSEFARREQVTVFTVLLTAFATVLGRWTGQQDVTVCTPAAGTRPEGAEGVVGFAATTLPLRISLAGDPSLRTLLHRAGSVIAAAVDHRDLPFEEMVGHAPGGGAGLARAGLALNPPLPQVATGFAEPFEIPLPGAQFDVSAHLSPGTDGGFTGRLVFATELFGRPAAERMAGALRTVLLDLLRTPERPTAEAALTGEAEQRRLVHGLSGAERAAPVSGSLAELFERQVDATPEAVAVTGRGIDLSYRELDSQADRLAHRLRALGVGPEHLVAVHLTRSPALVATVLGIAKAGAGYLPLDVDYPAEHLRYLIEDARPKALITDDEAAARRLADGLTSRQSPDDISPLILPWQDLTGPGGRVKMPVHPDQAAYVIYTSGSTGQPKGAVNTQAGLVNLLRRLCELHPLGPGDAVLHRTPLGFDVSVLETLRPLVRGARLVIGEPDDLRDFTRLGRLIHDQGVTEAFFVPSMLRAFLASPEAVAGSGSLRRLLLIGEELTPALAARTLRLLPRTELLNLYGPAEAAVAVTDTAIPAPAADTPRLPIGRPLTGAPVLVLDDRLQPVPVGVPGQLCLGGVHLARGYHGRPGLTAARFVPDPFRPGERLYLTGDRGRWREDGLLEFLGRLDHQVKIRGRRVEPGEVEAVLGGHPALRAAAVVAGPDANGDPRLIAYVVGADGTPDQAELRAHLLARMPEHQVPRTWVVLPELPLNPSGKVDRRALPEPSGPLGAERPAPEPPSDPVERELAAIWAQALGLERPVGRDEGFYELGGHSLLATRILSRIRGAFGVELSVAEVLRGELTVATLAELVRRRQLEHSADADLAAALARLNRLSNQEVLDLLAHHRDGRP
ncbi:non-ribosomal peptide synthetase [Kitasatospora brasiliensis]|uniref:non-ribosomal peptide synthetase n=1 Tax=Kitasatospora brasiliensis TaxID=3058040 RepID=UPI00292CD2BC|nr:non-ribosomal peptide synthetase [Kitasatospora sp. K002]